MTRPLSGSSASPFEPDVAFSCNLGASPFRLVTTCMRPPSYHVDGSVCVVFFVCIRRVKTAHNDWRRPERTVRDSAEHQSCCGHGIVTMASLALPRKAEADTCTEPAPPVREGKSVCKTRQRGHVEAAGRSHLKACEYSAVALPVRSRARHIRQHDLWTRCGAFFHAY